MIPADLALFARRNLSMTEESNPYRTPSSPAKPARSIGCKRGLTSALDNPRVTQALLGPVAGALFGLVLLHAYQIVTGTYPAGKMEMLEQEDPPGTGILLMASLIGWSMIGLLPRRVFVIAVGAGVGCIAGYFLAWVLAGVRLGDPLYLEYQIGIRKWLPTTAALGAVIGVLIAVVLTSGWMRRRHRPDH